MNIVELLEEPELHDVEECKGLFFRVSVNDYYFVRERNEYTYSTRIRLLKSISCPGCSQCQWLLDDYGECGAMPILPDDLRNGDVVTIAVTNISHDYETGYVDGYDLEFVKVKQ